MVDLSAWSRIESYAVIGVACAVALVAATADFIMGESGPLHPVWEVTGQLSLYIIGISMLGMIYGLYFYQHLLRYRVEFTSLMETKSKAMFIRNLDRIEYLAWKLGEDFSGAVQEKREGFGIKRRK
jgi:hypothetical protein